MPIYEYRCDSCGSQRELFVKPGGVVRPSCAKCRKRMRRVISQTAFILKGSGWYVTDYPSEARKKGLEGESAPAPAAETPAGAKAPAATEKKASAPAPAQPSKKPHKKRG